MFIAFIYVTVIQPTEHLLFWKYLYNMDPTRIANHLRNFKFTRRLRLCRQRAVGEVVTIVVWNIPYKRHEHYVPPKWWLPPCRLHSVLTHKILWIK